MRLRAFRIFVDDLAAARHFYGTALGLPIKWEWEQTAIGFDLGVDLIVEVVGGTDPEAADLVGRFTGGSIEVADIAAAYVEMRAKGIVFTSPPERQPWGGVLAHFQDPSRNILTLSQV